MKSKNNETTKDVTKINIDFEIVNGLVSQPTKSPANNPPSPTMMPRFVGVINLILLT